MTDMKDVEWNGRTFGELSDAEKHQAVEFAAKQLEESLDYIISESADQEAWKEILGEE